MADVPSFQPFLADKHFQRGAFLQMMVSSQGKHAVHVMVEHVKPSYLVLSYELKESAKQELLGSTVRIRWETDASVNTVECEVIQEQTVWPIRLLGMIPTAVSVEIVPQKQELLTPDYIINVPYKVMGARPIEEKKEGVLLKFSPTRLVIGTDGYVAKGDFIHLSFVLPHLNQELVGMAKVVEKTFQERQSVIELIFTDISAKHHQLLKEYYKKLAETAS